MSETREFHLGDILSVTTGRLVSPRHIDGVYDILNWMTGDSLFTHQLPRASRECEPHLLEQHPQLADIDVPDDFGPEGVLVDAWLEQQVARFGEMLSVAPLAPADHTHIDALTELSIVAPQAQIIPFVIPE